MAYSPDAVRAKLATLNETQDSIVSVAQWLLFHRRHADRTAQTWLSALQAQTSVPKRLNLVYLANEIVQQSRARGKQDFVLAFEPIVGDGVGTAYKGAGEGVQGKIRRVVEVWRQRGVFDGAVLDIVEGRMGDVDRGKAGGKNGGGMGKLGGSLFGGSGAGAVPAGLEGVSQSLVAVSKAVVGKEPAVESAEREAAKMTDPAALLPTPPVHAARLSAVMRSLANAQGAVEASILARRELLQELEKLIATNRVELEQEEATVARLAMTREVIETKKREVEDGIMRGLSNPPSPGVGTPTSGVPTASATPTHGKENGGAPDAESLTPPPPEMESFTPDLAGNEGAPTEDTVTLDGSFVEGMQADHTAALYPPLISETPPSFEPPSAHSATNANGSFAVNNPTAYHSHTEYPPVTVTTPSTDLGSPGDPRLKRRKLHHAKSSLANGNGAEAEVDIFGTLGNGADGLEVDEEGVAALLGPPVTQLLEMLNRDKRQTADLSRMELSVPSTKVDRPQHRHPRLSYGSELNSPDSSVSRKPRATPSREETVKAFRVISKVLNVAEDDQDVNYGLDTGSDSAAEEVRDSTELFTTRERGENVFSPSDFSPPEAKQDMRDPTMLAVSTVHQYDVKILNGESLCTAAKKQILKTIKRQVLQMDGAVCQFSRSSFVTTQQMPQLEQPLLLHVHIAADAEATIPASRAKYVKVHDHKEDGETVKKWMLLSEMVPIPLNSGLSPDTERTDLKDIAERKHAKVIGEQEGKHWTHTVVITADHTEETIGRSQLLDHDSTDAKRSRVAQLVNNCMLSQLKPEGSFSSGNRLFGEAMALNCGLEVRDGITVKPGVGNDDEGVHIIQTECKQHFYQPILLSDFMLACFGPAISSCDASKAEKLTKILKGVQVIVATSKGGKSRTVQSVTHKTVSNLATRHGSEKDPITLDELYENHCGKRLRHPNMPCVNIGLAGRDVLVSAEACQLVPNQPFNHKLPFYAGEQIFTLQPEIPKPSRHVVTPEENQYFPFTKIHANKLDVMFAQIVIVPSSRHFNIDQLCVLKKEQWTDFQNTIKCRFKGVVSESVRKYKIDPPTLLPYALREPDAASGVWAARLQVALDAKRSNAAAPSIVVVALPDGKHNADIYKVLKKTCETVVGVQCKVIRTNALSKVLKTPIEGTEQRRFAGAIVRNLLARTLNPPALDHKYRNDGEYQLRFPETGVVSKRGVLFGIHVQSIASSKIRTGTGDREWKVGPGQLVTITSSANWIPANVLTTHHLLPAVAGEVAADHLSTCVKEHINSSKLIRGAFTHVVLYRSGEGAGRRNQLPVERNGLVYDHFDSLAGLTLVAYAPETVVQVLGDEAVASSGQRSGLTASEHKPTSQPNSLQRAKVRRDEDRSTVDRHLREMTNPFGLDAAFRKVYVRDPPEVKDATRTYLLTHVHIDLDGTGKPQQNDAALDTSYSVLRNTTVPDILHLAQQASKYIQRFVEEVPSGEKLETGEQVMKFELQDVVPELRKTLYYV
ncbi:hypothetical protein LTR03_013581 [Friedmanniomyces endolithicus]|nr:hypothetical protein LTR03_013581 [Friedmanniomyces endolithicus]